jgi:hypothetical protein
MERRFNRYDHERYYNMFRDDKINETLFKLLVNF